MFDDTTATEAADEWSAFDPIEYVNRSGRLEFTTSLNASELPDSVIKYIEHQAVNAAERFADRLNTGLSDCAVTRDDGVVSVKDTTPFDRRKAEIDAALSVVEGLEEHLQLEILEQRRRRREWCDDKGVDPDTDRQSVPK